MATTAAPRLPQPENTFPRLGPTARISHSPRRVSTFLSGTFALYLILTFPAATLNDILGLSSLSLSVTYPPLLVLASAGFIFLFTRRMPAGATIPLFWLASLASIDLLNAAITRSTDTAADGIIIALVFLVALSLRDVSRTALAVGILGATTGFYLLGTSLYFAQVVAAGVSYTTFGKQMFFHKQEYTLVSLAAVGLLLSLALDRSLHKFWRRCSATILLTVLAIGILCFGIKSLVPAIVLTVAAAWLSGLLPSIRLPQVLALIALSMLGLIISIYNFDLSIFPEWAQSQIRTYFADGTAGYNARFADTIWVRTEIWDINYAYFRASVYRMLMGNPHNVAEALVVASPYSGLMHILPSDFESGLAWLLFTKGLLGFVLTIAIYAFIFLWCVCNRKRLNSLPAFYRDIFLIGLTLFFGNLAQDNLNSFYWISQAWFLQVTFAYRHFVKRYRTYRHNEYHARLLHILPGSH